MPGQGRAWQELAGHRRKGTSRLGSGIGTTCTCSKRVLQQLRHRLRHCSQRWQQQEPLNWPGDPDIEKDPAPGGDHKFVLAPVHSYSLPLLRCCLCAQVAPEAQLFFIAEYLRNIGCRIKKAVAAPGSSSKQAPAPAQTSRAAPSQAAREADVLLNDPRAAFRGAKGKRS